MTKIVHKTLQGGSGGLGGGGWVGVGCLRGGGAQGWGFYGPLESTCFDWTPKI